MEKKTTKPTTSPRYDKAFRTGSIPLVAEQHRPAKEVAAQLGICIDTLRSWLKAAEMIHLTRIRTRREAENAIFAYIACFYNAVRPHAGTGWLSLSSFEKSLCDHSAA